MKYITHLSTRPSSLIADFHIGRKVDPEQWNPMNCKTQTLITCLNKLKYLQTLQKYIEVHNISVQA